MEVAVVRKRTILPVNCQAGKAVDELDWMNLRRQSSWQASAKAVARDHQDAHRPADPSCGYRSFKDVARELGCRDPGSGVLTLEFRADVGRRHLLRLAPTIDAPDHQFAFLRGFVHHQVGCIVLAKDLADQCHRSLSHSFHSTQR